MIYPMNRLQEYLKTPNPVNAEMFTPLHLHYDPAQSLFPDEDGTFLRPYDWGPAEITQRMPQEHHEGNRTPIIEIPVRVQQKMIDQKLFFDGAEEQIIQTPMAKEHKDMNPPTTSHKKYDLRVNGNPLPPLIDSKEQERTLRLLTSQAYNVVCRKGAITYKQVSQEIINNNCDLLNGKEQNNIKRRVYDALNVLIALGKLEKKGRRIMTNPNTREQALHREKVAQMKKLLSQKQELVKHRTKVHKLELKKRAQLRKLISRNAHSPSPDQVPLPFIALSCQGLQAIHVISAHTLRTKQAKLSACQGDLDALLYLKLARRD